jgi:ACS family tartrate transporter-like MFS transporter
MLAVAGLAMAGLTHGTWWSLIGLSISTVGIYGMKPSFWPMPSLFLTGTAAAAGIAWINAVGNLAGTVAPWIVGIVKDYTGSFTGGLLALSCFALMSSVMTLLALPSDRRREMVGRTASVPAE